MPLARPGREECREASPILETLPFFMRRVTELDVPVLQALQARNVVVALKLVFRPALQVIHITHVCNSPG